MQDFMHVILGVLPDEIRLFLKYFVKERELVNLKQLNNLIASFDYGHLAKDKRWKRHIC